MKKGSNPKKIGRYRLLSPIGRGGMSIVYRARAQEKDEIVALKLLYPLQPLADLLGMEKLKDIFSAEAKKMMTLNHPHIVKVLDMELEGQTPYFTMEYHCKNIGMMINENFILEEPTRIINPEKVIDYGYQILEGLKFIHDADVIHRDIKPHNILLTDMDTIKICDFGTAIKEDEEIFDSTGLKVGSPYYIAPEQDKNPENADQRSDLYSVGVLLCRILTGELQGLESIPLSNINPIYDNNWDDFFIKALERDPALRFQNANEMTAALMKLEMNLEQKINSTCKVIKPKKSDSSETMKKIRTNPMRVAGTIAREAFHVNGLWQPERYLENIFTDITDTTVVDLATGLIWQRKDNSVPVYQVETNSIIKILNDSKKFGISTWRVPTVNELLTLVNDPRSPESNCSSHVLYEEKQWYWSCDRRSENTSWYVNTRLGYIGWQDNSCRNYVRAVASLPSE